MSTGNSKSFRFNVFHWLHVVLSLLIAAVWLVNGLYAKLLNAVPRHQMIVASILGEDYSYWLTKAIGVAELVMVAWILSRILPRLCAVTQILIVMTMNILEVVLAKDLLLFGGFNVVWAAMFCGAVWLNEFIIRPRTLTKSR
jgi:hypothetical protein